MKKLIMGLGVSILLSCMGVAHAETDSTTYSLKFGGFYHMHEATAAINGVKRHGVSPVSIHENPNAEGGRRFEVWAGEFAEFDELWVKVQSIRGSGADCDFTRSTWYDFDNAEAAIKGDLPDYFERGPQAVVTPDHPRTIADPYLSLRGNSFDSNSTAAEVLEAMETYLTALPDDHPAKGRDVIAFARRSFSAGGTSYSPIRPTYHNVQNLLLRVANRDIAATDAERKEARDLVGRLLHYYDRDYIAAFRAYNQMIREDNAASAEVAVAQHRVSLAGAILEYRKESGFSNAKTQAALDELWKQNIITQEDYLASDSEAAKAVRFATARIGLMINMNFTDLDQWADAETITTSLIAMYSDAPDCRQAVAEAWTQLCGIYLETDRVDKIDEAASNAMAIGREIGKPTVGDKNRDIIWKAYTWQWNAAVRTKNKSREREVEVGMRGEFPEQANRYLGPKWRTKPAL